MSGNAEGRSWLSEFGIRLGPEYADLLDAQIEVAAAFGSRAQYDGRGRLKNAAALKLMSDIGGTDLAGKIDFINNFEET